MTTYKITFTSKSAIGIALYELFAWDVSLSQYCVSSTDFSIYHASANVVDVITESLAQIQYAIEEEQK